MPASEYFENSSQLHSNNKNHNINSDHWLNVNGYQALGLSTFHVVSHLILTTRLRDRYYYPLTNEETKAQRTDRKSA